MKSTLLALFVFVSIAAFSQESQIERVNSYDSYGYCQVVKVGNTLYLSGITGRGPMDQSVKSVYERIEKVLKDAGIDFGYVVKENLFTTDIEAVKANNSTRMKFYNGKFPAATWVQVDRLFQGDYNLEVEVIAVLP